MKKFKVFEEFKKFKVFEEFEIEEFEASSQLWVNNLHTELSHRGVCVWKMWSLVFCSQMLKISKGLSSQVRECVCVYVSESESEYVCMYVSEVRV